MDFNTQKEDLKKIAGFISKSMLKGKFTFDDIEDLSAVKEVIVSQYKMYEGGLEAILESSLGDDIGGGIEDNWEEQAIKNDQQNHPTLAEIIPVDYSYVEPRADPSPEPVDEPISESLSNTFSEPFNEPVLAISRPQAIEELVEQVPVIENIEQEPIAQEVVKPKRKSRVKKSK